MPNIIRQTRTGSETLPWLRALLLIAHEARKSATEVQEALQTGGIKTHQARYNTEVQQ